MSDIAKTLYKYYYKDNDIHPSLIHVQTILTDDMDKQHKSQYLNAISVINSMRATNLKLDEIM